MALPSENHTRLERIAIKAKCLACMAANDIENELGFVPATVYMELLPQTLFGDTATKVQASGAVSSVGSRAGTGLT
jgi:hypothetical protein